MARAKSMVWAAVAGGAAALIACATLPDLHYACDGDASACPAGWGCSVSKVCRAPSGRFAASSSRIHVGGEADQLAFADFDGDGRRDLVITSPGRTQVDVHFFADESLTSIAQATRPLDGVVAPAFGSLTAERHDDLVVARDDSLTVALGKADHTFGATAYPSINLPVDDVSVAAVRFISTPDRTGRNLVGLVAGPLLEQVKAGTHTYMAQLSSTARTATDPGVLSLFLVPKGPADLIGAPAVGRVDTGKDKLGHDRAPCDQVALAFRGEATVYVFSPCRASPVDGTPVPNVGPALGLPGGPGGPTTDAGADDFVHYDPVDLGGSVVKEGVRLADVDGDNNLDILAGTGAATLVAFGSGDGHFVVAPQVLRNVEAFPLAVADLNADKVPDLVVPTGVYYSAPGGAARDPTYLSTSYDDQTWVDAVVADVNGNGYPDIAAVRGRELVVLNGSPTPLAFSVRKYPLDGEAKAVTVGDLDGDAVFDLVVRVADDPGNKEGGDLVAVAWGKGDSFPEPPEGVGHFATVTQIGCAPLKDSTAVHDLGIVSSFDSGASRIRVALLPGETSRVLTSPFGLPLGTSVEGVALGAFSAVGHNDIVALASAVDIAPGPNRPKKDATPVQKLLVAPSTGDAQLDLATLLVTPGTLDHGSFIRDDLGASLPGLDWAKGVLFGIDLDPAPGGKKTTDEIVALIPPTGPGIGSLLVTGMDGKGLAPPHAFPLGAGPGAIRARVGDANGDGAGDIAVVMQRGGKAQAMLLLNKLDHQLDPAGALTISLPGDEIPIDVAFVGITQDRRKAVAVLTEGGIFLALLDGGRFTVEHVTAEGGVRVPGGVALAGGDADGDGIDDLAVAGADSVSFYRGLVGRQ